MPIYGVELRIYNQVSTLFKIMFYDAITPKNIGLFINQILNTVLEKKNGKNRIRIDFLRDLTDSHLPKGEIRINYYVKVRNKYVTKSIMINY
jgi:hypothetical protein